MQCNDCQHLLIDLAYGATHVPEVAAARAHVAECSVCRPALQKLERSLQLVAQLPLLEPSAKASNEIMRLARNHALTARTLGQAPMPRPVEPPVALVDRVRVFLSQFAMGRQVAMATVMVLVIAVGLWFVPRARQHDLAGGNVVNPDPDGEAGPSNGIVPAAPLDLDLRQGRIRARDDEKLQRRARETTGTTGPASPAPVSDEMEKAEAPLEEGQPAEANLRAPPATTAFAPPPPSSDEPEQAAAELQEQSKPEMRAPARKAMAEMDDFATADPLSAAAPASGAASAAAEQPTARYAPAPAPPSPARIGASTGAGRGSIAAEDSLGSAGPGETQKGSDTLPSAAASFRAGDYRAAIEGFEASRREHNGQLPAGARLSLARSYQRTDRCDAAVSHYETFLRAAPRSTDAMLELANCYRRLGRTSVADQWTRRAASIASSAEGSKSDARDPTPATVLPAQ